jgi:hypothetical protein
MSAAGSSEGAASLVHISQGPNQAGGLLGCSPQSPQNRNIINTDFVDIMIPKVLRDLPFSRNQPLKLADDWCIRILKSKLIK